MKIKNVFKFALVVVAIIAAAIGVRVMQAQPGPGGGILGPGYAVISGNGGWTNRIAGSTSFTNFTRIDGTRGKELAVQFTVMNTQGGATNQTLYLFRSVIDPSSAGSTTNMELFATLICVNSGSALTSTTACTNFGSTLFGGIPFVAAGIVTNAFATGTSYMTNYSVAYYIK